MDEFRPYERETDLEAAARIWYEIGWIEDTEKTEALGGFLDAGNVEVAVMNGEAECLVHWSPGSVRYQDEQLSMGAITAVTTSQIGRKRGFASSLTASALAQAAEAGHAVAMLGMFEQGFYDRFGFGTGAHELTVSFDPGRLDIGHVPYRVPERIPLDAHVDFHAAMAGRLTSHGSVVLDAPDLFAADIGLNTKMFALGYRDDGGALTHFLAGSLDQGHGPWDIRFLAYRNTEQLLELLRLLKELSDQIRLVKVAEPAHVQLQALQREPIRERWQSKGAERESSTRADAWYQLRMLDVDACVSARRWIGPPVRFNLTLHDPLGDRRDGPWPGVGGEYTVTFGETSGAAPGHRAGLPTLDAGIGAFSRLWFGVRPATVLATTDRLAGPQGLLRDLDAALALPHPVLGWEF
ncbi:MAG: GNAT family N-acetyltransferase [Actinomycetota bacterium]